MLKQLAAALLVGTALSAPSTAWAYKIFVSNEGDNTITVIDSATMEVIETVPVGQRPRGITITHDGKYVLLCASDDDTVQIIDSTTYEIVGTLPSGPDPELFVLHPTGGAGGDGHLA
jgi:YVTN family beta-propeller protein